MSVARREDDGELCRANCRRAVQLLLRHLRGTAAARNFARGVHYAVGGRPASENPPKAAAAKAKPYRVGQVVIAYDKITNDADNG